MKSVNELREIAHRARHYDNSHGDAPVVVFPRYLCDTDLTPVIYITYRDIAEIFEEMATHLEDEI